MADIEDIKKEYDSIIDQLADPELISDGEKLNELAAKKTALERIIDKEKGIQEIKTRVAENNEIIKSGEDPELVSLASAEIAQLTEKIASLEQDLEKAIKSEGNTKSQAVIMEIRAGTGGNEASLFAGDLFRMYSRFAKIIGWQCKVLDSHPTELGGYKEIVFELSPSLKQSEANDIWSYMKYEAGVHRVQRIPETEKSGRVHTSTISVAVLPKPKANQMKIRPDDLKIEFFRSSGPGGQNVNKRETAVRIIHIPTGVVVASQTERSQLDNRENALTILAARLIEKQEEMAAASMAGDRKAQIGWAKRSEKIRTYNFAQDRITDHRIKKNWHNIERILGGEMEQVISDMQKGLPENS